LTLWHDRCAELARLRQTLVETSEIREFPFVVLGRNFWRPPTGLPVRHGGCEDHSRTQGGRLRDTPRPCGSATQLSGDPGAVGVSHFFH